MPTLNKTPLLAEILAIASQAYTEATTIGPEDGDHLLAFCLEEIRETFISGSDRTTALHEAAIALENVADDINAMIAALQAAQRGSSLSPEQLALAHHYSHAITEVEVDV